MYNIIVLFNRKISKKSKGFFDTYFNTTYSKARVVMVDAEPKVIKSILDEEKKSKLSIYNPKNVVYSEVSRFLMVMMIIILKQLEWMW